MEKNVDNKCSICGCQIHRGGNDYAKPDTNGRSHATSHHCVAKRFFYHENQIFDKNEYITQQDILELCYECHEELLHNPIFFRIDIERFAQLARLNHFNEKRKSNNRKKIAGRIRLLHEVIEQGIKTLLEQKNTKPGRHLSVI
jgi:hypothetical protein